MQYKVLFHAFIEGRKQTLDAVFESPNEPKLNDKEVIKAVMHALSDVVNVETSTFTIEFHIDAVVPII